MSVTITKTWAFEVGGTEFRLNEAEARALYGALDTEFGADFTTGLGIKPQREWTDEELGELRERYERGEAFPYIAVALRRSQGSVEAKAKRLGLSTRRSDSGPRAAKRGDAWTAEEDERLRDLVASGLSFREVALALGRTRGAVGVRASQLRVRSTVRCNFHAVREPAA